MNTNEYDQEPLSYDEIRPAVQSVKDSELANTDRIAEEFGAVQILTEEILFRIARARSFALSYTMTESKDSFQNWLDVVLSEVIEKLQEAK